MSDIIKLFIFHFALIFPILFSLADNTFVDDSNKFLSVDDAFKIKSSYLDAQQNLSINFDIADGYYLYKSKFEVIHSKKMLSEITFPKGKFKSDEYFGEQEVFFNSLKLVINFKSKVSENDQVSLKFQGCSEKGLCYPPTVKPLLNLNNNASISISPFTIQKKLQQDNLLLILLGFFISGLLLSVTPCVLPMVPVLSGIIMASNQSSSKTLTICYVSGVCITYASLGIIAGITGTLLSSSLQNVGFLYLSSSLFILFGLMMLDVISIKLPLNINNIVSQVLDRFKGGAKVSVFFMGLFSALILSPCVAPPLAAAILYIGKSGDLFIGGISLLFMAIGMCVPLIILGFSSKIVLPKPGIWMNFIKKLMGFILLGMSAYIIRPVLSETLFLSILLVILTITLLFSLMQKEILSDQSKKIKGSFLIFYLIIASFLINNITKQNSQKIDNNQLSFMVINNKIDLNIKLKSISQKPQMLDFYADWCVACLEYEKYTFKDDKVKNILSNFNLLKADVTENTNDHKELMSTFELFGPPGILFFDKNGNHLKQFDIVGFMEAEEFSIILRKVIDHDK
jgi:thiol:disulfide interchange protein DsbD